MANLGATPTNPGGGQKAMMEKPQGGGKCLVQIPGGAQGVVLAKIDRINNGALHFLPI